MGRKNNKCHNCAERLANKPCVEVRYEHNYRPVILCSKCFLKHDEFMKERFNYEELQDVCRTYLYDIEGVERKKKDNPKNGKPKRR